MECFKIVSTGDLLSDSECNDDESDNDERNMKSKSNFARARAFVAQAVQVKTATTAQVSKPLHVPSAVNTRRILSDGPTTQN